MIPKIFGTVLYLRVGVSIRFVIIVEIVVSALYMLINTLLSNNFSGTCLIIWLDLLHKRAKLSFCIWKWRLQFCKGDEVIWTLFSWYSARYLRACTYTYKYGCKNLRHWNIWMTRSPFCLMRVENIFMFIWVRNLYKMKRIFVLFCS